MVGNTSHLNQMAIPCPDDAADVLVESRLKVISDQWCSVLCGKDDVIGQLCECAHNEPCLLPPFHGGWFGFVPIPHAEAWGYALCSFHERIAAHPAAMRPDNTHLPRIMSNDATAADAVHRYALAADAAKARSPQASAWGLLIRSQRSRRTGFEHLMSHTAADVTAAVEKESQLQILSGGHSNSR